jgi:hypothetical protein
VKPWHFFLFSCLIASTANAREGFFLPPLPEPLQKAWENTYAVTYQTPGSLEISQDNGHGTAFVIGKQMIDGHPVVEMLTAGHVLDFGIGKFGSPQGFRAARFFENIHSREFHKLGEIEGLVNAEVRGGIESGYHDLALFVLAVDQSFYDSTTPIPVPDNCSTAAGEEQYIFGFPDVDYRGNESEDFIPEQGITQKRWSWGKVSSQRFNRDWHEGSELLTGSSADCVEGCSGGPAIGANGALEGMITQIVSSAAIHGYVGADGPKIKTHSLLVTCQGIKSFLQQAAPMIPKMVRGPHR